VNYPAGGGIAPTITTTTLPNGTIGTAYSQTLAASGSTPITWNLDGGTTLPAGLSLNHSTGEIFGIPTTVETTTFTVKATNSLGDDTKSLLINITAVAPSITTALPNGIIGVAYSQTLAATGTTPITWRIESGNLPAGLSLNSSTGEISGIPTTEETAIFTVKASNGVLPDDTKPLSITIQKSTGIEDIDNSPSKSLKAWMHGETLHVSGLTTGQAWSVYNIFGALIYQSIANGDETDIILTVRGVYVVTFGGKCIKVVY
jgi:hypothetical protein